MINGRKLITMDGRNVVFSVVQDRSKIQTFAPALFQMSTQQQYQTAEKSVQTQESPAPTTMLITNRPVTHFHAENTATEVANTLVSMATSHQRTPNGKQLTVINVPPPASLPILSLADYTTSRGVPTAMALANQAKLSPVKHDEQLNGDPSMSTDDCDVFSPRKTRTKSGKRSSTSKSNKQQTVDAIQYGPISVKPRKNIALTLANGRRSKDQPLPPDEDQRRTQRRDRNKEAAAKCRRKRNELRKELEEVEKQLFDDQKILEQNVQHLTEQKNKLEILLHRHICTKKTQLPITTTTGNMLNISKGDFNNSLLDSNNNGNSKRVTLNFSNAQDLFSMAPLSRVTSTMTTMDGASTSNVPMITIHIIPEVAQALLGSTSVDRAKLVELLQQVNANNPSTNSAS